MRAFSLTLIFIILCSSFVLSFETTDPELKKMLEENPAVEVTIDSNPEYQMLADSNPELFKAKVKEIVEQLKTEGGKQQLEEAYKEEIIGQFKSLQDQLNAQADQTPTIVKWFIGEERVNLNIDNIVISMRIKEGRIGEIKSGGIEKPTMELFITMNDIIEMSKQNKDLASAFETGKITVKPLRFITKVKIFIIKKVYSLTSKRMAEQ